MRTLLAVSLLLSMLMVSRPVQAGNVTFYMKFSGASVRKAPSIIAPLGAAVAYDANYPVLAHTPDGAWLQLGVGDGAGWLPRGFGDVNGDLAALPVVPPAVSPINKNTSRTALPAYIVTTPRGKALYQQAPKAGHDPRMFTIVGDSNAQWPVLMGLQAGGHVDVGSGNPSLRAMLARFDPAMARVSVAVGGGFRAADMFDGGFSQKPASCLPAEGVFVCELRQSNASVLFIQLGTGDRYVWRDFEATYRKMLDTAMAANVLPVLFTKADELEQYQGGAPMGYLNDTIRKLAAEYQLPLVDFFAATRPLPTVPNPKLPDRPLIQHGLHDEWGYYFHLTEEGRTLKLVCMLQMLDAITR